jgi:hypothetical protein
VFIYEFRLLPHGAKQQGVLAQYVPLNGMAVDDVRVAVFSPGLSPVRDGLSLTSRPWARRLLARVLFNDSMLLVV